LFPFHFEISRDWLALGVSVSTWPRCKYYGVLTAEIVVLAFVVCGGIFFELLKLVPTFWDFVVRILAKVGVIGKGD